MYDEGTLRKRSFGRHSGSGPVTEDTRGWWGHQGVVSRHENSNMDGLDSRFLCLSSLGYRVTHGPSPTPG